MSVETIVKFVIGTAFGTLFLLATAKVHAADLSKIHVKPPKEPQQYEVCDTDGKNCQVQNAAEATVALLKGDHRVFIVKRTEQELQQTSKGLGFTAKK